MSDSAQTQIDIQTLKDYFWGLQDRITAAMSALDGKVFVADEWQKPEDSKLKGYGRTCILDNGNILEKGGVGFSHVRGAQQKAYEVINQIQFDGMQYRKDIGYRAIK